MGGALGRKPGGELRGLARSKPTALQSIASNSEGAFTMFGNFEVFIQLFLLALVLLAGPAVIFVLYFRGADM